MQETSDMREEQQKIAVCSRRPDGGPHLPRFPQTFLAQRAGADYSCAYCGKPCNNDGTEWRS